MNADISPSQVAVSRPKITLLMILCGVVGAASIGAAAAATTGDPPSVTVKYDPSSLATDSGARSVYHRLARAAEQVCPEVSPGTHFASSAILQCRREAVERAVLSINHPRLAAIYATGTGAKGT